MYLILHKEHFTFNLQYKHSGTFANHKYEELCYPENQKFAQSHSSDSSENATP